MGRPKSLLVWRGVTLLEYQIGALLCAGVAEVVVVLGHEAETLATYVERTEARFVVNNAYSLGKSTSIKAGLRAIDPDAEAVLLLAVDQPRTSKIISEVIHAHFESDTLITSPRFEGHGGHPLIFSTALKDELGRISEEKQGIREVFAAHRRQVAEVHTDDPMVRLDINTPDDYERAKLRYDA